MDFSQVRRENDQLLSGQVEQIRSAQQQTVLEPFARAYLGMFYDIDNSLPPEQRVTLLASEDIAGAVLAGFEATVLDSGIATPAMIGQELAGGKELSQGYVVLAGMDRLASQGRLSEVSDEVRRSAICFAYSNTISHAHAWLQELLADEAIATSAFNEFWGELMRKDIHLLPGMKKLLLEEKRPAYIAGLALPILEHWQVFRLKMLKPLLQQALFHADHNDLLIIARQKIDQEKLPDENQRVLWLASAFLLAPDIFEQALAGYIGRVKQKVLPLLDFVMDTLSYQQHGVISANAVAQLLRVIAPIFPPQFHVYGTDKVLDVNSQNVMFLFHQLAAYPAEEKIQALKLLRKARVMKVYKKIIDFSEKAEGEITRSDQFRNFLQQIIGQGLIVEKSNRFD